MNDNLTTRPVDEDEAGPAGLGQLEPAPGTPLRELATPAGESDDRYIPGHLVRVVLEDGQEWVVRIDNRDYVRFDRNSGRLKIDASKQPFLFQSFLAYAASVREGRTSITWETFLATALETKDVKNEDRGAGDEDAARPTR